MIFDNNLKELISAAFVEEKDVFLCLSTLKGVIYEDEITSVVLLPSAFTGSGNMPFCNYNEGMPFSALKTDEKTVFCDVRFLADSSFREFLLHKRVGRIIIPFAECADKGEWKYREAFRWTGEFRAECPYFCQVVAIFLSSDTDYDRYREYFGSVDVIFAGEETCPLMNIYETESSKSKFFCLAALIEKYAYKRICVFFNSRNEAESFGRFLSARATRYLYINGASNTGDKKNIISRFRAGETNILLVTTSFVSEQLFTDADIVFFAGVPFSVSAAARCADLCRENKLNVVYCDEDIRRNEKISQSLAEVTGDKEITEKRCKALLDIMNIIEKEK